VTREKALAIFDALVERGYSCSIIAGVAPNMLPPVTYTPIVSDLHLRGDAGARVLRLAQIATEHEADLRFGMQPGSLIFMDVAREPTNAEQITKSRSST
jgi:hypothetical protein